MEWKERAEILWHLLDDVSTAQDMCHPETSYYTQVVNAIVEQRNKLAQSQDGHTLEWFDEPGAQIDFL